MFPLTGYDRLRFSPPAPGMHRFVWDLRYAAPKSQTHEYPIAAIYKNTPREPRGALVVPGQYTVKLTTTGQSYSQPLTVVMDPRVKTSAAGLQEQLSLSLRVSAMMSMLDQSHRPEEKVGSLKGELLQVFQLIQGSDNAPSGNEKAAVDDLEWRVRGLNIQPRAASTAGK